MQRKPGFGLDAKKRILREIYVAELEKSETAQMNVYPNVKITETSSFQLDYSSTQELLDLGYLFTASTGEYKITKLGRRQLDVVMAGGTFDIIHPGHLDALSQAKSLGDVLVVSVARNKTVQRTKGRTSVHDEQLRRRLVASLKCVDAAILGSETDIFETVDMVRPDIVAIGYDQYHTEQSIIEGSARRGIKLAVRRLSSQDPSIKTSKLLGIKNVEKILRDI